MKDDNVDEPALKKPKIKYTVADLPEGARPPTSFNSETQGSYVIKLPTEEEMKVTVNISRQSYYIYGGSSTVLQGLRNLSWAGLGDPVKAWEEVLRRTS